MEQASSWSLGVKVALAGASLTATGLSAGALAGSVFGTMLRPPEPPDDVVRVVQPAPRMAEGPLRSRQAYIDMIVGNNLFDHEAIGKASEADEETEIELGWRVLATMVAVPARFSTAFVALDEEHSHTEALGVGDAVGDITVLAIDETGLRVRLADGQEVDVPLYTAAPERKRRRARRGRKRRGRAIEKVGRDHVEVNERLVKRYVDNPSRLARLGRARPHRRNGQVVGYRLSRIRRNSHGHRLGLRNGDIVKAVNGHDLTSMNDAMNAYAELQNEKSFEIKVERRRGNKTLRVDLR